MKLIDELRDDRADKQATLDAVLSSIAEGEEIVIELRAELAEYDLCIAALEPTELVVTEITKEDAVEQLLREEDEVFADAYAVEIVSELTGDPAIEAESGLHGEAVSEEGYAPVTNPEADAIAQAQDWYSPEQIAEREKASRPWSGMGNLWGKPKVDA